MDTSDILNKIHSIAKEKIANNDIVNGRVCGEVECPNCGEKGSFYQGVDTKTKEMLSSCMGFSCSSKKDGKFCFSIYS